MSIQNIISIEKVNLFLFRYCAIQNRSRNQPQSLESVPRKCPISANQQRILTGGPNGWNPTRRKCRSNFPARRIGRSIMSSSRLCLLLSPSSSPSLFIKAIAMRKRASSPPGGSRRNSRTNIDWRRIPRLFMKKSTGQSAEQSVDLLHIAAALYCASIEGTTLPWRWPSCWPPQNNLEPPIERRNLYILTDQIFFKTL